MIPIVIYHGPSMLDGAPIVVLASVGSSNVKTGAMVQTWILRADMNPSQASSESADSSVCGSCPRRHSLGGDCYVQIVHAPRSVYSLWERSGKPGSNWADETQILRLQKDARDSGLRLGSYGDPAAVPFQVWQDLIDALAPRMIVGYTHQWQTLSTDGIFGGHAAWFRDHVMASCDSVEEAELARSLGWRFFLATDSQDPGIERAIQCPATREENPLTCRTCGICSGSGKGAAKASVFLVEHGTRSQSKIKRSASLAVLA